MAKFATWEVAAAHAAEKGKGYSQRALLIARVTNFVNSHANLSKMTKLGPIAILSNQMMEDDMIGDCATLCRLLGVEQEDVVELLEACDTDAKVAFGFKKEG